MMCDLVFSCFFVLDQGLKHAGRMRPTRAFYVARDAFWEF